MSYMLSLGAWRSVFAVPAEVVDKHLRLAGAAQLKVLLFLLRHSDCAIDAQTLSENIGISIDDTKDAVEYWVNCGLLCDSGSTLLPARNGADEKKFVRPEPEVSAVSSAPAPSDTSSRVKKEKIRYSFSECAEILDADPALSQMLPVVEGILEKQLNHTELTAFVSVVSWYGMSPDCFAMLVSYCKSIGKATVSYIEATARDWANDDILTLEKAEKKIERLTKARNCWNLVRNAFDIPERKPTTREEECSVRWLNEWALSMDMIKLAYEKCVDAKGKPSFTYINGILKSWHERGITTVQEANELSAPQKSSSKKPASSGGANSSSGRYSPTYDIKEIEEMLDDDWIDN